MKKLRWVGVIIAASGALAFACFFVVRTVRLRGQVSTFHPFTATMVDYHCSRANQATPAFTEYSTVALRSDGALVRVHRREFAANSRWYNMRVIFNPAAATRIAIDPITQSITTYHLKSAVVQLRLSRERACAAGQASTSSILGYSVVDVGSRAYITHNTTPAMRETWEAPSLDCLALKDVWRAAGENGAASIRTRVIEATNVVEGDPSTSLFQIPAGYQERSPSQVLELQGSIANRFHRPTEAILDKAYQLAR